MESIWLLKTIVKTNYILRHHVYRKLGKIIFNERLVSQVPMLTPFNSNHQILMFDKYFTRKKSITFLRNITSSKGLFLFH